MKDQTKIVNLRTKLEEATNQINKYAKDLAKAKKDLLKAKKNQQGQGNEEADIEAWKVDIQKAQDELQKAKEAFKVEMKKATDEINALKATNKGLVKEVKKLQNMKGKKSNKKVLQKEDVNKKIKPYVDELLSRTMVFARPGNELTIASQKTWNAIKDDLKLDDRYTWEEFLDIYASSVQHCMNNKRSYIQSRGKNAGQGESLR